jgi:HD-like signal output (HDOD) protein/ActR/RegA family two-component response regulator
MRTEVKPSGSGQELDQNAEQVSYALLVTPDLSKYKDLVNQLRRPGWHLSRCYIGTEALRMVATGRYDLVLCDKTLPDIPSTNLLQVVKNKFPWVKMVIFSPVADSQFASEAMELGLDYFLDLSGGRDEIARAWEVVASRMRSDSDQSGKRVDLIVALRSLPAIPRVVLKLWEILDSGEDALHGVVSLVRTDPGLTAMTLRVANSVRYGSRAKIRNLERAISLIGLSELRSLSVVHSTRQVFRNSGQGKGRFNLQEHWSHCARVALTAELLAKKIDCVRADFAFSAGLLHDLGTLVLTEVYHKSYDRVIEAVSAGEGSRRQVESELLGIDHSQAGGIICEHWNLPDYLFDPIRHHHTPQEAEEEPRLTAVVHLADLIVHRLDQDDDQPPELNWGTQYALDMLDLKPDDLFTQARALESYLQESAVAYTDMLRPI